MKAESSFGGYDFTDTWAILEGVSYPYLKHPGQLTVNEPPSPYPYPSNGQDVTIEGTTDSSLTLRYLLADGNNGKLDEGAFGSISGGFSYTKNFGVLSPGKYSLWLWGTYGARGTEGERIELHVAPDAPTSLQAVAGDREVTLQWNAVTGADSYTVYAYKGDSAPTDPDDWQVAATGITSTSHTVTGLNYGKYWFTVRAVVQGVEGALAPAVSAEPQISVASVETLKDLRVKNGTPLSQVGLPNPVQVTLVDHTTITVPVK